MPSPKNVVELPVAPAPIIGVNSASAARMLGNISETLFFERVSRGELPRPRKIGGRSVWLVEDLVEAARALPISDDTPLPRLPKAA